VIISGSKIHRVWKCPASAALPQVERDDEPSPARDRGTKIHAFLERVARVGRDQALAECSDPELYPLLAAIDTDALPVHLACEVAFAYNWRTQVARELGRGIGRNYELTAAPPTADEIPCTLDLVGQSDLGDSALRGYVGDYKTGHGRLPAPDRNGQLLLGALCARSAYDCEECVLELIHIHRDGDHHRVRRTVDSWELGAFAAELASAMESIPYWRAEHEAGRPVGTFEGAHCDHCQAFNSCPAKTALIRAIPRELMAIGVAPELDKSGKLVMQSGVITAANAAEIWVFLERLEDVVDRAKQEICGIAAVAGDIPLPDGRVIGRIQTERRVLDGRIGAEVIEERYGRQTRDEVVELKLSITAVQKAVTKHLKPGQKVTGRDGVLDVVIAEIERRGGVGLNTTDSIKPHVPRKKAAAR
jgi:hypothetical protein